MVRRRLVLKDFDNFSNLEDDGCITPKCHKNNFQRSKTYPPAYLIFFTIVLCGIGGYFIHYLINKWAADNVTEKANLPLATLSGAVDEKKWGSYRPHLYFGLRNRLPDSPLFGLIWYKQPLEQYIHNLPLRHWCEHGDNVEFMWEDCDSSTFGHQRIGDNGAQFYTDWLNYGHSWWARVTVKKLRIIQTEAGERKEALALIFYLALQDFNTKIKEVFKMDGYGRFQILTGVSGKFGKFSFSVGSNLKLHKSDVSFAAIHVKPAVDLTNINDLILRSLRRVSSSMQQTHLELMNNLVGKERPNFIAVQITVSDPTEIDLIYKSSSDAEIGGVDFVKEYQTRLGDFRLKFSKTFSIQSMGKWSTEFLERVGRSALSNLLGGIGIWHGNVTVKSVKFAVGETRSYGSLSLQSAVPSRPFFPRGFIWDEGFHNILIGKFDPLLTLNIIASWLDTMNSAGWMPREMILGPESEKKVPAEFLIQSDDVANPPVFFFLIGKFLKNSEFMMKHGGQLRRLYPRLKLWYNWLQRTQSGPVYGSYRWDGRNGTTNLELNPKTLPSGLDDYPRASHPNRNEYHLDIRCWMAVASRVLRTLAEHYGEDASFISQLDDDIRVLNDPMLLDQLHWSETVQSYCDYGLHSKSVHLVPEHRRRMGPDGRPEEFTMYMRKVKEPPRLQLVDDVNGYVSLFPFFLQLLPPDSPKLEIILRQLNSSDELWTPYGIRSLSKKSPYYMKRNTEHDAPYWRGAIWININYLVLEALRDYAQKASRDTVRQICAALYVQLRHNLVNTIVAEYVRTGFFWENYADTDGKGQGTRPFTGWTALVLGMLNNDEEEMKNV